MKKYMVPIFLLTLILTACNSTRLVGMDSILCGVVNDNDNKPVAGYELIVNGNKVVTDSQGIFFVSSMILPGGKVNIRGSKKGYESVSLCCNTGNCSDKNLLEVNVSTIEEILEMAEEMLQAGRTDDFKELFLRIGNENDPRVLLAQSMCECIDGNYKKAEKILLKMKSQVWSEELQKYLFMVEENLRGVL